MSAPATASGDRGEPSAEERRWLHDTYMELAWEESQLSGIRTSYFATIGAVLVTGMVIVVADFSKSPALLVLTVTFLAGFGLFQAIVWALILHRTSDAQNLWREAAFQLEQDAPPVTTSVPGTISLDAGRKLEVDFARPFAVHRQRFARARGVPRIDRLEPNQLLVGLPYALVVIWVIALVATWTYYFVG